METKNILPEICVLVVFLMLVLNVPMASGQENTIDQSISKAYDKASPDLALEENATICKSDDDCVSEQCCHPTSCVNKVYAPDCTRVFCTAACQGPLDCGAGSCKCVNNACAVVSTMQTECEKNRGVCISWEDNCPEGYNDSDFACKTRSEKCCVKICPKDCTCMTEAEARAKFNGNHERCSDVVCGYGYMPTARAMIETSKYCFKEKTPQAQCLQGCECLDDDAAEEKEMVLCNNERIRCAISAAAGVAVQYGHCYEKQVFEVCHYNADIDRCVGGCPEGMKCRMFYVVSMTQVKDVDTGELLTPNKANISANELAVGSKVCKCIKVLIKECLDNCRCLTKIDGYKQGLYLCNNNVIICGYVVPEALTNAAPNALGIPKYCFGEPVQATCLEGCECMSKDEAYKREYELCNGVVKKCGVLGNVSFYCFQKPTIEECGRDTLAVIRRIDPKVVSPPSYINVYLNVKPKKTINGIIITEKLPEGTEPVWDYSAVTFDAGVEEKIKAMPIAAEIVKEINVKWTSRRPDLWDLQTREAKWIIRNKDGIKPQTFMYKLKIIGLQTAPEQYNPLSYDFKGNWLLSSNETCPVIGDGAVEIKPMADWPPCPISDLELLQYIDLWSNGKLTDMQILQAIYVWAKKPSCSGIGVEIAGGERPTEEVSGGGERPTEEVSGGEPLPMEELPFA